MLVMGKTSIVNLANDSTKGIVHLDQIANTSIDALIPAVLNLVIQY